MKKLLFLATLTLLGMGPIFAQQQTPSGCGTPAVKSDWLTDFQRNPENYPMTRGGTEYIPMTIHVVGTDDGSGYFALPNVLKAFCKLNQDFEQANIQFFLAGEINYLNNSDWYDHTFNGGEQMMNQNNVFGTANCYIVSDPAGNCGYFTYQGDAVALAKGCLQGNDDTWAHEMGHFLSLPHTFFGWEYFDGDPDFTVPAPTVIDGGWNDFIVEKADGSNCNIAGDGFCDTPADYLAFLWTCNGDGVSTQVQTDPDGTEFSSDGSFYMTYADNVCSSVFSQQQINAMHGNLNFERPELLSTYSPQLLGDEITLLSPADGETLSNSNEIVLEWEPVDNATHYIVEISPLPNFPFVYFRYTTTETTFTTTDLAPELTYYWRIQPYNQYYTCLPYDQSSVFYTAAATSTKEINGVNDFGVRSNPVQSGHDIELWMDLQNSITADISLLDIHGRTLTSLPQQVLSAGYQEMTVPVPSLSSGLYVIRVATEQGYLQRRIIIW